MIPFQMAVTLPFLVLLAATCLEAEDSRHAAGNADRIEPAAESGAEPEAPVRPSRTVVDTPEYLRYEKPWNYYGPYCGPNSLYVLARLLDRDVSIQEVLDMCPLDPRRGCTMSALENAARKIGLDAEVRFVGPSELESVKPPYVLHVAQSELDATTGHFLTVCEFVPKNKEYNVIDGTSGAYDARNADALYRSYSGYILIASNPHTTRWMQGMLAVAFFLLTFNGVLFWRLWQVRRMARS